MSHRDALIVLVVVLAHAALLRPSGSRNTVAFAPRGDFVEITPVAREPVPSKPAASPPGRPRPVVASDVPFAASEAREAPAAPPVVEVTAADVVRWGNEAPTYPEASRQAEEEGTVVVVVSVAPEGTARAVRLGESSGHEALDRSVLEAAGRWKFPSKAGDYRVRVEFALQ